MCRNAIKIVSEHEFHFVTLDHAPKIFILFWQLCPFCHRTKIHAYHVQFSAQRSGSSSQPSPEKRRKINVFAFESDGHCIISLFISTYTYIYTYMKISNKSHINVCWGNIGYGLSCCWYIDDSDISDIFTHSSNIWRVHISDISLSSITC